MKKKISFFCLTVLLANVLIPYAFSQETPVFLFTINERNIGRVGVVNNTERPARFYIKDSKSEKVVTRIIKEYENSFEFMDLSKLPDGLYTACFEWKEEESKKFAVADGKVKLFVKSEFKPRFRLTDNKILLLNYYNKYLETITINIEEGDNVLLSDVSTDKQIAKKYSLSELLPGAYNIRVVVGEEVYNHPINLQ